MKHDRFKTKGWKSFEIIKKYSLKDADKGKLFLYTPKQCNELIKKLIENPNLHGIDTLITNESPHSIEKYKETFILAQNEEAFYKVFNGEARNIIQNFFKSRKNLVGICQLKNCNVKDGLETAHLTKERKDIFKESALNSIVELEGELIKYDVYKTMTSYLLKHQAHNRIRFLCKKHHIELDALKKGSNKKTLKIFKDLISNDMDEIEKKKLKPSLVPAFPIGLKYKQINSNSGLVEWKKEVLPINYKIMKDGNVIYNGVHKEGGLKISGLTSSRNYEFSLISYNDYGESPTSYLNIKIMKD
ncbi:fibronectin type III domain-containing protein [Planomicrobium soli]|nr:fibronectin type III domain-containing protein [Planomicrobium soli]